MYGWCGDFSLVNDVLDIAVSIKGAHVWFPAVAVFLFFIIVNFSFIVVGYNRFDIIHATVA